MTVLIAIVPRKESASEPGQGTQPSQALLGRAQPSNHVKTQGTKNTANCPLPHGFTEKPGGDSPLPGGLEGSGRWGAGESICHFKSLLSCSLPPTLATLLLLCARPSCFPFLETGWPFSSSEQQVTGKGAWAAAP